VQVAEIERMKQDVHPMQAKKELAQRIVADFHSAEAAAKAEEDWAKQFQKGEAPEDVEEVQVSLPDVLPSGADERRMSVSLGKLLVKCGLADSMGDASRKIKQESVWVNGKLHYRGYELPISELPVRFLLRVGRRVKVAIVHE
jgi:tyrosyl-tRNA synthetase